LRMRSWTRAVLASGAPTTSRRAPAASRPLREPGVLAARVASSCCAFAPTLTTLPKRVGSKLSGCRARPGSTGSPLRRVPPPSALPQRRPMPVSRSSSSSPRWRTPADGLRTTGTWSWRGSVVVDARRTRRMLGHGRHAVVGRRAALSRQVKAVRVRRGCACRGIASGAGGASCCADAGRAERARPQGLARARLGGARAGGPPAAVRQRRPRRPASARRRPAYRGSGGGATRAAPESR
jgi:hypothetical protein